MMKSLLIVIGILGLVSGCDTPSEQVRVDQAAYVHQRPVWSPDGKTIAFSMELPEPFGIWLVDTNGTNLRQLHSGNALSAAWSPDGNWVAFSEAEQIFARNIHTDSLRLLVPTGNSTRPHWSPDGNKLLVLRQNEGNRLVIKNLLDQTENQLPLFGFSAAWMPSGTQVFFVTGQALGSTGPYKYMLQRSSLDGISRNTITEITSASECFWFRYDSTNARIVYEYSPASKRSDIKVIEFADFAVRTLVSNGGSDPALSPDGAMVAYTATTPDEGGIWVINIDGTGNRRITKP